MMGGKRRSKSEFHAALRSEIDEQKLEVKQAPTLACPFPIKRFRKDFISTINAIANEHFRFRLSRDLINQLVELIYLHITHHSSSEYFTGVVLTGYGKEELFPSVVHLVIDGRSLGMTRVWDDDKCVNLNEPKSPPGAIIPFAQSDMAHLFMEGIAGHYLRFLAVIVGGILGKRSNEIIDRYVLDDDEKAVEKSIQEKENEDMLGKLGEAFSDYRSKSFTKPILNSIRALPKEEMAYMAKALVEITALRRRFASSVESVGGDIDVAIISKSDGFIWISRKHYFDIDINSDFFHRRAFVRGD